MSSLVFSRTFKASAEGLTECAVFLREALDSGQCPVRTKSQLMVALDEIASNIVNYSGSPDFTLSVESGGNPLEFKLIFSDSGRSYNPLEHTDPDVTLAADDREIGGLGLFMVKKLMDDVSYSQTNGCNVLTLRKRITI